MTLLNRLRTWLDGLFGGTDSDAEATSEDTAAESLDPDNVTQVRADATDDSVAKLREVKRRETRDDGTDTERRSSTERNDG